MIRTSLFACAAALFALTPACAVADGSDAAGTDGVEGQDAIEGSEPERTSAAATIAPSTYFKVRQDVRRCAWPMCGGYWVSRANFPTTRCDDGAHRAECYVVELDVENGLGLQGEDAANFRALARSGNALLRGAVKQATYGTRRLGFFVPTEGWAAATDAAPTGTFYSVRSSGIVCITTPCPSFREATLNTSRSQNVHDVDLSGSGASQEQIDGAFQAIADDSILAAGENRSYRGFAGRGTRLVASQFYTRVRPTPACTGPVAVTPAPSEIQNSDFANTTRDTTTTPPTYERHYRFDSNHSVIIEDYVAPCPAGAVCVWSGIVSQKADYTIQGDKLELVYASTPTSGFGLSYYKELAVERSCDGSIQIVEVANDGTGARRTFTK